MSPPPSTPDAPQQPLGNGPSSGAGSRPPLGDEALGDPEFADDELLGAYLEALRLGARGELRMLREGYPALAEDFDGIDGAWQRVGPLMAKSGSLAAVRRTRFGTDGGSSIAPSSSDDALEGDALLRHIAANAVPFERYAEAREIARGGMGSIQRVWDSDLRRHLVMKVMLSPKDRDPSAATRPPDQRLISRFLEEAQLTGQLDHPGILPVHDLGLDPEGRLYFTMPLVKGQELGEVIDLYREGDSEWTRARLLSALLKACEAVAYSHSRDVIHRDLKPDNIMVGRFGETYVMDWGLARVMEFASDASQAEAARRDSVPNDPPSGVFTNRAREGRHDPLSPVVTLDGDMIGTPGYMAPEQARGDRAAIGPRADVYAMGAILYQIVTGWKPYDDPLSRASGTPLIERILGERPVPIEKLTADLPSELRAITEKAMAEDQEDRYDSMVEMADDLRAYIEGRVVSAYETGVVAESKKWMGRNKLAAGALALLLIGGTGAGGAIFVQQQSNIRQIRVEQGRTEEALKLAREEAEIAEAARDDAEEARIAEEQRAAELQSQIDIVAAVSQRAQNAESDLLDTVRDLQQTSEDALFLSYTANLLAGQLSLDSGQLAEARRRLLDCDVELRGFEWEHLWLQTDMSLQAWDAHAAPVVGLAAGGGRVTTLSSAGEIVDWDMASRRELERRPSLGDAGNVEPASLARSADGRWTAVGYMDGSLWLRETGRREPIQVLPPARGASHNPTLQDLAFSPGSDQLAIARGASQTNPSILLVLDVLASAAQRTPILQFSLDGTPRMGGTRVAWDPRGRLLALGRSDGVVELCDTSLREEPRMLDAGEGRPIDVLAYDASGAHLVCSGVADGSHSLEYWNMETGHRVGRITGHDEAPTAAAFTADGRFLVSGSTDASLRLWRVGAWGQPASAVLSGHLGPVTDLEVLGENGPILSCGADGSMRLWNLYSGESIHELQGLGAPTAAAELDFARDAQRLITWGAAGAGGGTSTARVIDTESLATAATLGGRLLSGPAHLLPDGERAASISSLGGVVLWSLEDGSELSYGDRTPGRPLNSVLSPAGTRLAVVEDTATTRFTGLQPAPRHQLRIWELPEDPDAAVLSLVTIPLDGRLVEELVFLNSDSVLIACSDGRLCAVRISEERIEQTLTPPDLARGMALYGATSMQVRLGQWLLHPVVSTHRNLYPETPPDTGRFTSLAVSPRTQALATGDDRGRVLIWDMESWTTDPRGDRNTDTTGEQQGPLELLEHRGAITDLCFDPTGQRLLTACVDGGLRLFDAQRGELVTSLSPGDAEPVAVDFAPSGDRIAAYLANGAVRLYETQPRSIPQPSAPMVDSSSTGLDPFTAGLLEVIESRGLSVPSELPKLNLDALGASTGAGAAAVDLLERSRDWLAGASTLLANPARDNDLAWRAVAEPGGTEQEHLDALDRAENAVAEAVGDTRGIYERSLAAANYRLGRFDEALIVLEGIAGQRSLRPEELALTIACEARSNRALAARARLVELEAMLLDDFWSKDPVAQSFAQEARDALMAAPTSGGN